MQLCSSALPKGRQIQQHVGNYGQYGNGWSGWYVRALQLDYGRELLNGPFESVDEALHHGQDGLHLLAVATRAGQLYLQGVQQAFVVADGPLQVVRSRVDEELSKVHVGAGQLRVVGLQLVLGEVDASQGQLVLVDVGAGAHLLLHGAVFAPHRQGSAQHPAVVAGLVLKAVFYFEGCVGAQAFRPLLFRGGHVGGVNAGLPQLVGRSVGNLAGEIKPPPVQVGRVAVGVGGPRYLRNAFEQALGFGRGLLAQQAGRFFLLQLRALAVQTGRFEPLPAPGWPQWSVAPTGP